MKAAIHPLSLRFENPELEAAYLRDAFADYARPLRYALVVGIGLYAGFLWVDAYLFGSLIPPLLVNRGAVSFLAGAVLALTYHPAFARWVRPSMTVLHVAVGLGALHMRSLHPAYEGGIYAALAFFPLLARAQFQASSVVNASMLGCFAWLRTVEDASGSVIVDVSMLFSAVVVIGLGAYVKERAARIAFVQKQTLAEARDLALAASRAKSAFLANMSHELRTPLNAIIGYGEMLHEDAREAGHDAYVPDLAKITSSGRHLLGLIDDILDLSKVEAGRMQISPEPVDVAELVRGAASTVAQLVKRQENDLRVEVTAGVGTLTTDPTRLRQILLNLLGNAAKFTKRGTIRLDVRRVTLEQGDVVELAVSDTGVGMTPVQLTRIFEAFSQADATTTRDYGGTGLGLTISKHFAELLGGTLTAASTPGEGSTFIVRLPVDRPHGPVSSRRGAA